MQTGNSITLSGKEAKALGQRLRAVFGSGRKRKRVTSSSVSPGLWKARLAVANGAILEVDYGDVSMLVVEKLPCESTGAPIRLEVEAGALSDVLMQASTRKGAEVTITEIAPAPPGGWGAGCIAALSVKGQPVNTPVPAGAAFAGAQRWDWPAAWRATLAEGELERGLAATALSMSTDETRYYLQGVYFTPEGERLRVVSTDGHRLAIVDLESEFAEPPQGGDFICPAAAVKALQLLAKHRPAAPVQIAGPAAPASFAVGPDEESPIEPGAKECATISCGGHWVCLVRPIDGSFPDYGNVLPRKFSAQVDVDCGSLADALAAVISETDTAGARYRAVQLNVGPDTIEVSRRVPTGSGEPLESSRAVPCLCVGKPPPVAGFNARYLEELLAQFGGGNGNGLPTGRLGFVAFADGAREPDHCTGPVSLQPSDPDGRFALIMPMRV